MEHQDRIRDSIEYIEERLKEKIKLEKLAEKVYLSEFHYHRLFRNMVGEPVMEYIRKRRLSEAAKELKDTKRKVADIALDYQFGSPEAFTRAFKRMYGISPREFRKTNMRICYYAKANIALQRSTSKTALHMVA
ncbi:AraC family transcriptional regulator [Anaerosolibacter carboniphilus]|uniref:AraC family transcriptional regulator n=1 Tax=Anaerosolibacter carboniphilus TaxID=1417629 RepID=A0A841KN75_9FIRM|nr:helix-turn-helix transcriptional regulator [Anaerosolibacter carboniphilus]MBB6215254.1 AraC family transcriptional regulator [Anaerosolibacter carboniphilus]